MFVSTGAAETNEEVVGRYQGMITRIAFHYVKNHHDADDICQEAFIRWVTKRPAFRDGEQEKAWMIRVAVNLCKNHLKTAWFRKTAPLDEGLSLAAPEKSGILHEVLALPDKYKAVIYLHYYEGYKTEEIARILKKKHGTVLAHLSRARQILKRELSGGITDGSTEIHRGYKPS